MKECKFFDYIGLVHTPGDYVPPHKHDYLELIYYVCGEGTTNLGAEQVKYKAHTMQIVRSDVVHFEEAKRLTEVKCVGFTCGNDLIFENLNIVKNKKNEKFFEQILSHLNIVEKDRFSGEGKVDLNDEVWYIVLNLLSIIEEERKEEGDYYTAAIKNVRDYIKANFNRSINFAILCESIGYSYDWFRHVFKQKTGMSMKKYQQGLRISKAKILLSERKLTVKEIARRCGYKSDIRFIEYFRQTQSITPNQYRKATRQAGAGCGWFNVNQPAFGEQKEK
ncbi:MAG: AraC family transcriptional regulator [Clostridiales bacterium]|nr:AraC family transcriptional regulator [Clostridiales bacterium]